MAGEKCRAMSPLGILLMKVLRWGTIAAAAFVLMVIGVEGWKHWMAGTMSRADTSFMVVLVVMLVGALWLVRSIAREIRKSAT